LHGVSIC